MRLDAPGEDMVAVQDQVMRGDRRGQIVPGFGDIGDSLFGGDDNDVLLGGTGFDFGSGGPG